MQYYAEAAKECAKIVVFLGERNEYGVQTAAKVGFPAGTVHGFFRFQAAADFLRRELNPAFRAPESGSFTTS
jgi:hypothetical protein